MTTMPRSSLLTPLSLIAFILSTSNNIIRNNGGIVITVDASRAYPHGCLYRHPSYYTYDERDDISWFTGSQQQHFNNYLDEDFTPTSLNSGSIDVSGEFSDYRTLPPASHPIRRSYHQYKLLRRLGAGKFSNVFEAVDVLAAASSGEMLAKERRKKVAVDQAADNETTDISSSDNESTTSSSLSVTTTNIDPNTLVVLKCLKPISERKIRRELLVLTHCRELPNLARLIGIVIPSSMEKKDNHVKEVDVESVNKREHNRRHNRQLEQQQQAANHNHARKRRRYNHRTSRQLHHKQQKQRQQDIGSITTDAAIDSASRRRAVSSNNNNRNNDNTLANRKSNSNNTTNNNKNSSNSNSSSNQHGEQVPALVMEHAGQTAQWFCHGNRPSRSLSSSTTDEKGDNSKSPEKLRQNQYSYQNHLTEYEIKYYLCHLLIALDGLHAAGIMHRDVKPRNTLINLSEVPVYSAKERDGNRNSVQTASSAEQPVSTPSSLPPQPLMLVDLGLADFYLPGKEFNVRVASRHYKSPELLIGYEYYDYAIDMWSVGCILAGLLFRKEPFFRGVDNEDQLGLIVNCLGTRDFLPYCRKCNVRLSSKARAAIGKYCSESSTSSSSSEDTPISLRNSDIGRRKPWLSYLTSDCPLPSSDATDLLDKLLVYDHEQRWTAREALGHSFFDEVREEVWSEVQERILWESQGDTCKEEAVR